MTYCFTQSDTYRVSNWLITCGIPDISTRLATNSVNPCKRRKAVLETKYFVLFSANSLGDIYNVVPPAISWFINHSKYRYIYHKPQLLELSTNLAKYGAPPCMVSSYGKNIKLLAMETYEKHIYGILISQRHTYMHNMNQLIWKTSTKMGGYRWIQYQLPSGNLTQLLNIAIYSGFSHQKW